MGRRKRDTDLNTMNRNYRVLLGNRMREARGNMTQREVHEEMRRIALDNNFSIDGDLKVLSKAETGNQMLSPAHLELFALAVGVKTGDLLPQMLEKKERVLCDLDSD